MSMKLNFMVAFALSTLNGWYGYAGDDCSDTNAFAKAQAALTELESEIKGIPGVIHLEVGDCSEVESPAVMVEDGFKCGVFLYFKEHQERTTFLKTTELWDGKLRIEFNGSFVDVPVCSRVVARPRNRRF